MVGQHLLVCSIGNPAPYENTLHSAGHIVLSALARVLSYKFEKARGQSGSQVSVGQDYILWKSGSLMNVSGTAVAQAWKFYGGKQLVVLHDELELPLGNFRVKSGKSSAKGHNGLKSILIKDYTRIGIGIGRPISRDSDLVAAYVLRKIKGYERATLEACASKVLEELQKISLG
ncbi:Peptidyl-tRNA hydrolase [Erysiphe necator]|uniref:peptidyl-tRNA hydrolase n=1 Tax=Uncinula necator TaxID=52586 RepID=A0A0B1P8F3_UNCNE|nr:Peptidyl-tRNA hydrolase [Erysiphe necator]KHJ34972.1 putative peptidyl-trna hydrolase [Erysiphe necator]